MNQLIPTCCKSYHTRRAGKEFLNIISQTASGTLDKSELSDSLVLLYCNESFKNYLNQGRYIRRTSLNVSVIKFYDFNLFHYIHWNKACNSFQWILDNCTSRKSNVMCFKPRFLLFRLLKYYKILLKYSFCIDYSDILNKHEIIVYSLCFKKQTLELLIHLSFKPELPTNGL